MKKQLPFDKADEKEKESAKNIQGRILTDLYDMDISIFNNVNILNYSKQSIMEYISYTDNVYFFLDNAQVETREVVSSVILTMNRHNNRK